MLRNSVSRPGIGLSSRILAGLLPGKNRNRTSGRPKAGRRKLSRLGSRVFAASRLLTAGFAVSIRLAANTRFKSRLSRLPSDVLYVTQ